MKTHKAQTKAPRWLRRPTGDRGTLRGRYRRLAGRTVLAVLRDTATIVAANDPAI